MIALGPSFLGGLDIGSVDHNSIKELPNFSQGVALQKPLLRCGACHTVDGPHTPVFGTSLACEPAKYLLADCGGLCLVSTSAFPEGSQCTLLCLLPASDPSHCLYMAKAGLAFTETASRT
jgi:hypothetical protein